MGVKFIEISELSRDSPNYLMHHGIEKQKWGVRRGPPYPLKKGINSPIKKITKAAKNRIEKNKKVRADKKAEAAASKAVKKETLQDKINKMSDDELRSRINRLKLENEFKRELPREKEGETFLKKSAKVMNDLKVAGDTFASLMETGKRISKILGIDINDPNDFKNILGKNSYAPGESSADWSTVRKPGESMSDYAKRMGALSGIRNNVNNINGKSNNKKG